MTKIKRFATTYQIIGEDVRRVAIYSIDQQKTEKDLKKQKVISIFGKDTDIYNAARACINRQTEKPYSILKIEEITRG